MYGPEFDAIAYGHRCNGLSYTAIAREMGVAAATIKRAIRRHIWNVIRPAEQGTD